MTADDKPHRDKPLTASTSSIAGAGRLCGGKQQEVSEGAAESAELQKGRQVCSLVYQESCLTPCAGVSCVAAALELRSPTAEQRGNCCVVIPGTHLLSVQNNDVRTTCTKVR